MLLPYRIDEFLSKAVFYPCSGMDGAPIRFLANRFAKYFYADYSISYKTFQKECERQGLNGYELQSIEDLEVEPLFGCSWEEIEQQHADTIRSVHFKWSPQTAFVALARFGRLPDHAEDHGPEQIELLFARCEAIATVRSSYHRKQIAPRCLAHIRSGIGMGGNYSGFPKVLAQVMRENKAGLPEYLFYDHMGGDPKYGDYLPLVKEYEQIGHWNYKSEHYGYSNLTLGKQRIQGD